MTTFILLVVALTVLAVGGLVRPLLRRAADKGAAEGVRNAATYRDQLAGLDQDLAQGTISPDEHASATDELHLRLLDEAPAAPGADVASHSEPTGVPWRTVLVLAGAVPALAVVLYLWLGQPAAVASMRGPGRDAAQVASMVESLEAKLQHRPDNPKGWAMLARSYKVLGRLEEAESAYRNTGDLLKNQPDLMVELAELLAVRAGNRMSGEPLQLVEQALALDPQHPSALMMVGVAAYQRGGFADAVRHWEALLAVLEPGSPDADMTQTNLADAREQVRKAQAKGPRP
jgi:cytochrome c-type biogenesis protein CcmH